MTWDLAAAIVFILVLAGVLWLMDYAGTHGPQEQDDDWQ